MFVLFSIIALCVHLYIFAIILQVAMNWLIAFEIVKAENDAAQNLMAALKKLTDPVYTPLRKYVPPIGGIDITPLIVIIGLQILAGLLLGGHY